MRYLFVISLLLISFASKAQLTPKQVHDSLHKYTDSFMLYRCREICAIQHGLKDSVGYYLAARHYYQEKCYYWGDKFFDAPGKKTNVRYRNPNKFFKCPCQ